MKKLIFCTTLALVVFSCSKEKQECPGSIEKDFALTGFTKVNLGDANTVTVTKGNDFSIKAKGCADDLSDLDLSTEPGQILDIQFRNYKKNRNRVDFIITMPLFVSVHLSGAAKGNISGFQGQSTVIRTILSGASECILDGTGINLAVEISGASKLTASGATESLYGNISGASSLEAYGVTATEVDITVSGSSKARVTPINSIFAEASGASIVYYKGDPASKHFETSGNGKIVQE